MVASSAPLAIGHGIGTDHIRGSIAHAAESSPEWRRDAAANSCQTGRKPGIDEEIRGEFSALRTEIRTGDDETRRSLRDEIRGGDEETRHSLRDEMHTGIAALRDEIRAGDERVMNRPGVLHQELISRLALIQEGGRQRSDTGGGRQ